MVCLQWSETSCHQRERFALDYRDSLHAGVHPDKSESSGKVFHSLTTLWPKEPRTLCYGHIMCVAPSSISKSMCCVALFVRFVKAAHSQTLLGWIKHVCSPASWLWQAYNCFDQWSMKEVMLCPLQSWSLRGHIASALLFESSEPTSENLPVLLDSPLERSLHGTSMSVSCLLRCRVV